MAEADEDAPPTTPGSVPRSVSVLLLLALVGGVALAGHALEARLGEEAPSRAGGAAQAALGRDVLTGRRLDAAGRPVPPASGPGSPGQPLRLRFVPSADVTGSAPAVEDLVRFLERRTGYAIEGRTLRSYGLVVEEIVTGRCDVAFLTAASYARARYATRGDDDPDNEIRAFLGVVRAGHPEHPGADLAYRAALIVRDDAPLATLEDLSDETRVALGPRTSGAGSVLPTALFAELGVAPRVQRYEGYPFIVQAVLQGAVDVGSIWWSPPTPDRAHNDARLLVEGTTPDVFARTRIIGHTAWIPNEPVVIREAIPEEVRHTLARALPLYVALKTLTPEGREALMAVGGPVGLIPADDEDFAPLMEVIERAFEHDPEGRADFMRGAR